MTKDVLKIKRVGNSIVRECFEVPADQVKLMTLDDQGTPKEQIALPSSGFRFMIEGPGINPKLVARVEITLDYSSHDLLRVKVFQYMEDSHGHNKEDRSHPVDQGSDR